MKRFVPFAVLVSWTLMIPILSAQPVVINEFMFSPATGAAEWIELQIISAEAVNIRGWTLSDRTGNPCKISAEDVVVQPGGFLLLAASIPIAPVWEQLPCMVLPVTAFPSLNNSGDDIVIRDSTGAVIDSLSYTATWSSQRGVSAERIRTDAPPIRDNWTSSTAEQGGTPGARNSAVALIVDPFPRHTLLVNEIMPAPLAGSCEWVELYNTSADTVALARWSIGGKPDSKGVRPLLRFPTVCGSIPPAGHAVIAADSSVFLDYPNLRQLHAAAIIVLGRSSLDLGNEEDEIVLIDPSGAVIDSLRYSSDWHHPLGSGTAGISLELMNPLYHGSGGDAWSSCADPSGGTPGQRNSIYSETPPGTVSGETAITVSPVPFSPDGDGFEDSCLFRCRMPENVNQVRIRVYDTEGRIVATLRNNAPMGREALVVWDGMDDEGRRARIGCYVALLEGLDPASNTVVAAKAVLVVARRL